MVNLAQKIEEIRKQPDHVRERYVWGCVIASMTLILTIWFFSLVAMFKKDNPQTGPDGIDNLTSQLKSVGQQAPSLKDLGQQPIGIENEGVVSKNSADESNELQYPVPSKEDEIPQSAAYSNDN